MKPRPWWPNLLSPSLSLFPHCHLLFCTEPFVFTRIKPEANFQRLWPPTAPPKRKAEPRVASHSEGRQDSSNINTTYLALSAPQSFLSIHRLILRLSQCALRVKKKRNKKTLSAHKERNAVKSWKAMTTWWAIKTVCEQPETRREKADITTSQSSAVWSHGYMDKIEKQADSPKKTVSNPWTEYCLGMHMIAETPRCHSEWWSTLVYAGPVTKRGDGGCKNMRNHQTRREASSHEQYTQRRAVSSSKPRWLCLNNENKKGVNICSKCNKRDLCFF